MFVLVILYQWCINIFQVRVMAEEHVYTTITNEYVNTKKKENKSYKSNYISHRPNDRLVETYKNE